MTTATLPIELPPFCEACRSTDLRAVSNDLRRCEGCGAAYGWHHGARRWVRLAALFGVGTAKPKRTPPPVLDWDSL